VAPWRAAAEPGRGRQSGLGILEDGERLRQSLGRVAREHGIAETEQADAFAGGRQQIAQRQQDDERAVALRGQRQLGAEIHRRREIGRKPHGVGRFPLALADIEMIVACRAAPVDAARRLAGDEGTELPEGFTRSGAPAAMPAGQNRGRDTARLDQKVRQAPGKALGLGQSRADRTRCRHVGARFGQDFTRFVT
jgi:hypothetical protein